MEGIKKMAVLIDADNAQAEYLFQSIERGKALWRSYSQMGFWRLDNSPTKFLETIYGLLRYQTHTEFCS